MILLPWEQLTHVRTHYVHSSDCLHILQSALSLVDCKFGHVSGLIDQTVLLPCRPDLKFLRLKGCDECGGILGLATLPSLVELVFDDTDSDASEHYQYFVDWLSRSRPPLSRLSLRGGAYPRIIHGFPFLIDLTSLEISGLTVADMSNFLHDLVLRDPTSFLPNLESLASWVGRGYDLEADLNYGDLADALESRWNRTDPTPRLKSFRMTWIFDERPRLNPPRNFHLSLPRLRRLIEEGMDISVSVEISTNRVMSEAWITGRSLVETSREESFWET
ncbi:hypothetical protein C8R45DRAFT_1217673 [Mycena sanguinolenta]|nr:hypothetical protein C8R45DRAFT_1217673 [Mycena sanguinolenta]